MSGKVFNQTIRGGTSAEKLFPRFFKVSNKEFRKLSYHSVKIENFSRSKSANLKRKAPVIVETPSKFLR